MKNQKKHLENAGRILRKELDTISADQREKKNLYWKGKKMEYAQGVEDRLKVGRISIVSNAGKRKILREETKVDEDQENISKKG